MIPDSAEFEDTDGYVDPLSEEELSPVPNLVHRYPNRVLWLVGNRCAINCRFCTRKRRWKDTSPLDRDQITEGLKYLSCHYEIRDVLLSGGDPLLLPIEQLEEILSSLKNIAHIQIVRVGTRLPCAWPAKIGDRLVRVLKKYHPLFINIHFNHPLELTDKARRACTMLADAGIPLGSQTVLLRGVNDSAEVLGELFQKLLTFRVRPYYLMQMDLTRGTAHFRTPLATGVKILHSLRNHYSGLAIPQFVIDLPGGHGKVPLVPRYIEKITENRLLLKDYLGKPCHYPLLPGELEELAPLLELH